MTEKKSNNEETKSKDFIDQKIQYGESQVRCFACGEKIEAGTKVCPYCNTEQNLINS